MASGLEAISYWILFSSDVADGLFDCCGVGSAFTASTRIVPAVKSPAAQSHRRRGVGRKGIALALAGVYAGNGSRYSYSAIENEIHYPRIF